MMRLPRRIPMLLLLLLVVCAPGCGRPLMVTPTIFEIGDVDPFFELTPAQRSSDLTIFYATDRLENNPGQGDYGRGRCDTLDLGTCDIRLGKDNWPALQALATGQPRSHKPNVQITQTHRLGDLFTTRSAPGRSNTPAALDETAQQFLQQIEATLDASSQHEITLFIHGFNTSFAEAAKSCAEYAHYAGNQGAFLCYSWPSYNSLFRYQHDHDSARYTGTHLRQLVVFLAQHTSATKINFVCHSAGCQVIGSLLRELRLITHHLPAQEARAQFRIGQVFLVAPDINVDVARERVLEEGAADLFDHLTIYSSKFDFALRYAASNLYFAPRLGALREGTLCDADALWLLALDNVTIVDIDKNPTQSLIGHMHQRYNPAISSDILLLLRRDLTPAQRALSRDEGDLLWHFVDDYDERIREAALLVYPAMPESMP